MGLVGFFFSYIYFIWKPLFIIAGLVSVVIGTLMAVRQFKIKRFIAYSSITHMGYILLFISAFTFISLQYCICYLFVYIFTILSLLGIYYYVKIIKIIFFDAKKKHLIIRKKVDFSLVLLMNFFFNYNFIFFSF